MKSFRCRDFPTCSFAMLMSSPVAHLTKSLHSRSEKGLTKAIEHAESEYDASWP